MYCSLHYYHEVFFVGGTNIISYPLCSFLHTPDAESVDKASLILAQLPELLAMNAGVFPRRPHDALVTVFDGDGDKPLHLQIGDMGLNLAFADVEEFGKIPVGSVTATFVVERMDLHK